MNIGKIPENILKRSVLKLVKMNQKDSILEKGAAVGADCAFFNMNGAKICTSTQSAWGEGKAGVAHAMYRATNNLAAGASKPVAVSLHLMLPTQYEEADLKSVSRLAKETADKLGVEIIGGHTETLPGIEDLWVSVTAIGTPVTTQKQSVRQQKDFHIVMTKWAGISGTVQIVKEYEQKLLTRYPIHLVDAAKKLEEDYSVLKEALLACEFGVCAMHDVAGGGIYSALWELGEKLGMGLEVELKKIPIKQETIEVCEFLDINPYELRSDGALLIVAEDGYALCDYLIENGVFAQVIGSLQDNHDKVILGDEEKRFLEPARRDEWNRIRLS